MSREYVPLENLLEASSGSIYKLTILLAKRSFQIADGDKPLINNSPNEKPLEVAMREIGEERVRAKSKKK